jgi:hypothetical protein
MFIWFCTGYRNVKVMSGMSATPDFLNQVVYLAYNHHPSVVAIDTVRAFHLAYDYLVEVDIVLPQTMTVEEAHDIGEALQDKIEMLENVERAWVHMYAYTPTPRIGPFYFASVAHTRCVSLLCAQQRLRVLAQARTQAQLRLKKKKKKYSSYNPLTLNPRLPHVLSPRGGLCSKV